MQLRRYIPPARTARQAPRAVTVEPGTSNHHGQIVVRKAGRAADDLAGQSIYVLRCKGCGHEYGEAGIRVHQRKCPKCDGGKEGLPIPEAAPSLFDSL
jgi:predicted Zn-ribbon and HTH transcriptional regulator